MITDPTQADHIIRTGQADLVILAREMLRNPYWPLLAAHELKQEISWPAQYLRAADGRAPERNPVKAEEVKPSRAPNQNADHKDQHSAHYDLKRG
jgi:2,4-dienoyl-CoA reductase-like NADH-dependent reductase (Old Yellow Enzyme family)